MPRKDEDADHQPYFLITREQASQLILDALDADCSEPENFVRVLLILFDNVEEARLKDAIRELVKAAYDQSIVHSMDLDKYMAAVREGKKIGPRARSG